MSVACIEYTCFLIRIFPFDFVNNFTVGLDYIGLTPKFSYYDGISYEDYKGMITDSWNLRNEAIHYCKLDCIT